MVLCERAVDSIIKHINAALVEQEYPNIIYAFQRVLLLPNQNGKSNQLASQFYISSWKDFLASCFNFTIQAHFSLSYLPHTYIISGFSIFDSNTRRLNFSKNSIIYMIIVIRLKSSITRIEGLVNSFALYCVQALIKCYVGYSRSFLHSLCRENGS